MIKRNLTILLIFIIGAFVLYLSRDYDLKEQKKAQIEAKRIAKLEAEAKAEAIRLEQIRIDSILQEYYQYTNEEYIDLSEIGLDSIPDDLIDTFKNVKRLNLSNNYLTKINPRLLEIPTLEELDLSHNEISSFPENIKSSNIKQLNLDHNYLREPPIITGFNRLFRLDMSHNYFESMVDFQKQENNSLLYLIMNHNEITGIRGLDGFTKLEGIHVNYNHFDKINIIGNNAVLGVLKMANNSIETMKFPTKVKNMENLWFLDLDSNQITTIAYDDRLESLKELQLRNNFIEDFGDLHKYKNLLLVDLHQNDFSTVLEIEEELDVKWLHIGQHTVYKVIVKNNNLRTLSLFNSFNAIAIEIEEATELNTIDLRYCYFRGSEINDLIENIKKCPKMRFLKLSNTVFCEEGYDYKEELEAYEVTCE